jgi:hypothetical protein
MVEANFIWDRPQIDFGLRAAKHLFYASHGMTSFCDGGGGASLSLIMLSLRCVSATIA